MEIDQLIATASRPKLNSRRLDSLAQDMRDRRGGHEETQVHLLLHWHRQIEDLHGRQSSSSGLYYSKGARSFRKFVWVTHCIITRQNIHDTHQSLLLAYKAKACDIPLSTHAISFSLRRVWHFLPYNHLVTAMTVSLGLC